MSIKAIVDRIESQKTLKCTQNFPVDKPAMQFFITIFFHYMCFLFVIYGKYKIHRLKENCGQRNYMTGFEAASAM